MLIYILAITVVAVFSLIYIVALQIRYFCEVNRTLCERMDRASGYAEYKAALRTLRCHHLKLIPFVTDRNVMRVYERVYRKKNDDPARKQGFEMALMPSIIGTVICTVCLCGISFAWFTNSTSNGANKLQAASYDVEITVDGNAVYGGSCVLAAGNHDIIIKALSTATATYGYVTISYENQTVTTPPVVTTLEGRDQACNPTTEYVQIINISEADSTVTFTTHWGIPNPTP